MAHRGPPTIRAEGSWRYRADGPTPGVWSLPDHGDGSVTRAAAVWNRAVAGMLRRFGEHAVIVSIDRSLRGREVGVRFVENGVGLLSVNPDSGIVDMAIDLADGETLAAGIGPQADGTQDGLELLFGLGLVFVLLHRSGNSPRTSLGSVVDLYLRLPATDRTLLAHSLTRPELDPGGPFALFLNRLDAASTTGDRERAITWLLGQDRVVLPYDRAAVIQILRSAVYTDCKRNQLFAQLRTYDRAIERRNIERISAELREAGEMLVFGRMSRAFLNQGLLLADAVLLTPAHDWRELAERLARLSAGDNETANAAAGLGLLLHGIGDVPLAQFEGAIERFEEAALDAQRRTLAEALRPARARVENHAETGTAEALPSLATHPVFELTKERLQLADRIRHSALTAERRAAAYVVISQRPSPTGSHLLVKLNEFEDPYAGKPENLRKLFRLAGHRLYASPDYRWLEVADHWIEAIPLFIKEEVRVEQGRATTRTVVDLNAMETAFREEMADRWACNLRRVQASEWLVLARETLADANDTHDETALPCRLAAEGADPQEIAALGVLFGEAYRREITAVQGRIEQDALDPYAAAKQILPASELVARARAHRGSAGSWRTAVATALSESGWSGDIKHAVAALLPEALAPRRPLPALHVLTTQSAGMTEGYIQTWPEESMALYNLVEDLGLHEAVDARRRFQATRVQALSEKLIDELGLTVEVDEWVTAESLSKAEAMRRVASRNLLLREEIACLGALLEAIEARGKPAPADCVDDPAVVLTILANEADSVRAAALERWTERKDRPPASPSTGVGQEALPRTIDEELCLNCDPETAVRLEARRRALARLDAEQPGQALDDDCRTFLRRWQDLEKTTARRAVVAAQGLGHQLLRPLYYFRATGGGKRYHLLYTPSRVDLGARERESVESWSQWVGGADRAATQVGRQFYQLINKDVRAFETLAEPEVLKTGENASMVAHYAFSNALALMIAATRKGDVELMADQMNRRRDRRVHPAGEGYGGYCVPKDGLFLEFVLSLARADKLAQIGLPAAAHQTALALAEELLERRRDFASTLEWEAWAAGRMQQAGAATGPPGTAWFQPTRVAHVVENLGIPDLRDPARIAATLAARWGLHKMVTGGEQINRFMPFFKVWLIRQALAEAAHRDPGRSPGSETATVVLTAEYKPDTQDGRFSAGMRKFEILAGTGRHLLSALDIEGQDLATLLIGGYRELASSGRSSRILEWLDIEPANAAATARLDELFPACDTPAEIRIVAPTGLSTLDLMAYTGDSDLINVAEAARTELLASGFSIAEIEANLATHGPRVALWGSRSALAPEMRQTLQARLGGSLHAVALAVLGPETDYPRALRGADVLDTGIPHRTLLELLADPGYLCELMLDGNPRSALAIVDGTSGARPRAMNRLDVMLWFAAGDSMNRESVYVGIGLGAETVEGWRETMRRRRRMAEELRTALSGTDRAQALRVYQAIVQELRDDDAVHEALGEADRLARAGRLRDRDALYVATLARITRGLPLDALDFTGFLALGGLFLLVGAEPEVAAACRSALEAGLLGAGSADNGEWQPLLPRVTRRPARPVREARGVESSNKAVEENPAIALDTRRRLASRLTRARGLQERHAACHAATVGGGFTEAYRAAMAQLGSGSTAVGDAAFGRFIRWAGYALTTLASELADETLRPAFTERIAALCTGRRIDPDVWQAIAGGYEDIGDLGRLAQSVTEGHRRGEADATTQREQLTRIAQGAELFEILLAIDSLQAAIDTAAEAADPLPVWRALAEFFAKTLNDHHYDYRPWLYSRGIGFESLSGNALYRWAAERHAWLHRYLRGIMLRDTEVRDLSEAEQDALLGNVLDGKAVEPIGGEADDPDERLWRAYGQLREVAFIRNDGLPLPVVFPEFDPELIQDRWRVNHVIAAPVGRTHFSRMLAEGPTLTRELEADGRAGANLIISRKLMLSSDQSPGQTLVRVRSGHLYIDAATYRAAAARHRSGSTMRELHPKGVRIAARFTRPVLAALVYPFHGDPAYTSGALEHAGLPYTVQSRFHTWTTYDKAKYPDIFRDSGVELPAEIDWLTAWTAERDAATARAHIRDGLTGTDYPGLAAFARRHAALIVKDAAESGGRGMQIFRFERPDGRLDPAQLATAVDFVYQLSLQHNVAIQELLHGSPEFWATEAFMAEFVRRQIVDWGRAIERRREPLSPVYASVRLIVSTDCPAEPDPALKWHPSHWIVLLSPNPITNVGRGGTLEELLPEFIRPEYRRALRQRLVDAARCAAEALSTYEQRAGNAYERETGRRVGTDLMGVSYGQPRYLMLDFLVAPVFAGDPERVEVRAVYDDAGQRIGSECHLSRDDVHWVDIPVDWRIVLIEPNIGVGLWDRVALREEAREQSRARAEGCEPDWNRVGTQARIVLRDLNRAGEEYLTTLRTRHGE